MAGRNFVSNGLTFAENAMRPKLSSFESVERPSLRAERAWSILTAFILPEVSNTITRSRGGAGFFDSPGID